MTLVHVQRLFRYWGRQPPTHELIGARYGVKDPGPERPEAPAFTAAELAAIDRMASKVGLA